MIATLLAAALLAQGPDASKDWGKREWGSAVDSLRKGEDWSMHYAAEKAKCPVCSKNVQFAGMGMSWSVGGKDLDFKTAEYISANPYLFRLWMCPECNYCAWSNDFPAEVDVAKTKEALGKTKKYDSYFDIPFSDLLRRAEQCYRVRKFSDEDWAWFYLYGAWMARDSKAPDAEKEYHAKAQARFITVSGKGDGKSRAAAAYLTGEIYRRQNEMAKALEWIDKAEKISIEVKSENIPGWIKRWREELEKSKDKNDEKKK